MSDLYVARGAAKRQEARSVWFNLDNGSGTTIDDVIYYCAQDIKIVSAGILIVDATTGTVAAGNAKIGTTVGGAELVAATAYPDSTAVGVRTAMTLTSAAARVVAGSSIFVRHTGVASTAAGQAVVYIIFEPLA